MTLRERLRPGIHRVLRRVGQIRRLVPVIYDSRVSRVLRRMPGAGALYGDGWHRRHPYDRLNGTDTSGSVVLQMLRTHSDHPALAHATGYGGSQPSVVRAALDALPPLSNATFIDLGCGKGRPLLLAAERPFREVVGVELSSELAAVAQSNAAVMRARRSGCPPIRVVVGDAASHPLPSGDVVLFLYNPFGAPVVAAVVDAVERAVAIERRAVYVIGYNPVHGRLFDASPVLTRRWARMVQHAAAERGYGPDGEDAVVIWQGGDAPDPVERADLRIVLTNAGTLVKLRP
ncbi:MAG TPA: class I SAM-dependent methyltransferase [Polyangia bacterium]|jgi:SAM-dependent methyltransferase|nr:class I SAM-dependent methyltransferase [Polyangia bacterium]